MCLSVRGALRWSKRRLAGMFRHETGRRMNGDEAREALFDELAHGHEVIPMSKCEGFDFVTGCPGHERAEELPHA
jgi:hypothetical protein